MLDIKFHEDFENALTYAAAASGIYARLKWSNEFNDKIRNLLFDLLKSSVRRLFVAHGHDERTEVIDNLSLFRKAGAWELERFK